MLLLKFYNKRSKDNMFEYLPTKLTRKDQKIQAFSLQYIINKSVLIFPK